MYKFVSKFSGYRGCLSTANTSALNRLAAALENRNYEEFQAIIAEFDDKLAIRPGPEARMEGNNTFVLPDSIYPELAERLRILANTPEYEIIQLAELDPPDSRGRKRGWWIQRVEYYPEPKRDYTPNPAGAMWSAVIYHEPPSVEALEAVWDYFLSWSEPSKKYAATQLYVEYEGGSELYTPQEAFRLLVHGRAPTDGSRPKEFPSKVMGSSNDPFKRWYGETTEPVLIWFREDSILVFTADSKAEKGNADWDVENFFVYHSLVRALSQIINADRFAWWVEADIFDDTIPLPIGQLEDVDLLWDLFSGHTNPQRPLTRSKFDATFAAHRRE